ncbi:HipA domain-containing protein, partial [Achromobacter spanius]
LISPSVQIGKRDLDGPQGKATYSYARLADVTRRISSNPVQDLKELYARMILNVAVHNTDDHLKNVGFLKDEGAHTYRLAPLFDVVTQEGSARHYLHIGTAGRDSTFENCLSEYRRFGLRSEAAARSIVDAVRSVVARRQRYYAAAGMGQDEIALVESTLAAWRRAA